MDVGVTSRWRVRTGVDVVVFEGIAALGKEDPSLRAGSGAGARQQGHARPRRWSRHRGEEPIVQHRRRSGGSRPAQGRSRWPDEERVIRWAGGRFRPGHSRVIGYNREPTPAPVVHRCSQQPSAHRSGLCKSTRFVVQRLRYATTTGSRSTHGRASIASAAVTYSAAFAAPAECAADL